MAKVKPDEVTFLLRLPRDVHARLKEDAAGNSPTTSLHSLIVAILRDSLTSWERESKLYDKIRELETENKDLTRRLLAALEGKR